MNSQTSMSDMPDLYDEERKRLVLIVEDEYFSLSSDSRVHGPHH